MDKAKETKIIEELKKGDLTSFNKLSESQRIELLKKHEKLQLKYLMRNPTMTEDEFFSELDRIAEGTYEEEER